MSSDSDDAQRQETALHSLRLALLGFGGVNRTLSRLLLARRKQLEEEAQFRWSVTGLATASRGLLLDPDGIDLTKALLHCEGGRSGWPGKQPMPGGDAAVYELISSGVADVLVESTPLDPTQGEPATSYIRGALDAGLDVVTANKGPIAFAYEELSDLAARERCHFRFEAVVMGGAPIFSLFEFALPLARIHGVKGILNSTSNFVVSRMRRGIPEEMALAEAERLGIAEADPHHDLDGWDAALKLTILANVLMKGRLRVGEVDREPWPPPASTSADDVWRQEAEATRHVDGHVTGSVHWVPVPADDPFAAVDGTSMAVELHTDLLGKVMIGIADPSTEQTAYGLLADLLLIAGHRSS